MTSRTPLDRRNRRLLTAGLGGAALMLGLSFAAAPAYSLFCRLTGFGGTTMRASAAPTQTLDRPFTIRFDATVAGTLAWQVRPARTSLTLKVGEVGETHYVAHNRGTAPLIGTASYNVTPEKAAPYFNKLDCFCFTEQGLAAGARIDMPVVFFIDPAIANDPDLADLREVTLAYSFFPAKTNPAPRAAVTAPVSN